jgi:hypothetical protein
MDDRIDFRPAQTAAGAIPESLRILLDSLIDYAGLFPPAGLTMADAVANYSRYLSGPHRFALGKFIVPASRLDELAEAAAPHSGAPGGAWHLSALVGENAADDVTAIERFNREQKGRAVVDAVEMKIAAVADVAAAAVALPASCTAFLEFPPDAEPELFAGPVSRAGMRAKIRTGGVTPGAFPEPKGVVSFLRACAAEALPFKATAGLHHPLRCVRPLTYEEGSATGTMHGFVNLFLAAALAREGAPAGELASLLLEEEAGAFSFDAAEVRWRDRAIGAGSLQAARREFAIAFGSCSFEEPFDDMRAIGWIR